MKLETSSLQAPQTGRTKALDLINWLGRLFKRFGITLFSWDTETMLRKAERSAGFSIDSDEFLTGFRQLTASIQQEASLNTFGHIALKRTVERAAQGRLEIERELARNPEILEEDITEPTFVIGLPRTGTTILQALLSRDSRYRSPLAWECLLPYPAPTPETYRQNPRIDQIRKEFEQLFTLVPDFRKMHYMEADEPQECLGITALNFASYQYVCLCTLPSYADWFFNEADQLENMRWHKRFLQFMQSGGVRPARWLLKSPLHLVRFNALFEVYPDARIIMTHRDPRETVASMSSLLSSVRSAYTDGEDHERSSHETLTFWARAYDRFLDARDELGRDDQILDVKFEDFASDQIGTVDRIYAHFGWPLDATNRAHMQDFLRSQPKDKHGVHNYSLEAFSLTKADIEREYARYFTFLDTL
ncbi:MAG: sulfotransferase [Gammaproteobacteria bacterium]|nr:sulfotransferase [Gammaproteobacteria bacterium]